MQRSDCGRPYRLVDADCEPRYRLERVASDSLGHCQLFSDRAARRSCAIESLHYTRNTLMRMLPRMVQDKQSTSSNNR